MNGKQLSSLTNNSIFGMIDRNQVSNIVKSERKVKSITQKELGDAVGLSERTIQAIERGESVRNRSLLLVMNYLGYQAFTEFKKI